MEKLNETQIQQFVQDGYVRLDNAFSTTLASQCREILWKDTGCDPDDPATWMQPVIRLGQYAQEPFRQAANTPLLLSAYDQLAGPGTWFPRFTMGTFPVRFPAAEDPGDTGWHVDVSFPGEDPGDFFSWRSNIKSKGRALLMLFLFSDVEAVDAPTRLRKGSHLDVAKLLLPAGEAGLSFMELAEKLDVSAGRPEALATGRAGTVYLCHPFMAHAAQPHHGRHPRFLAQPPLAARGEFDVFREGDDFSPVEIAIRRGAGLESRSIDDCNKAML